MIKIEEYLEADRSIRRLANRSMVHSSAIKVLLYLGLNNIVGEVPSDASESTVKCRTMHFVRDAIEICPSLSSTIFDYLRRKGFLEKGINPYSSRERTIHLTEQGVIFYQRAKKALEENIYE